MKRFDLIAMEKLQPANMIKNSKLSRSISRIAWSEFVDMIRYKAEWYGKIMVQVDRFFPSSKLCSSCRHKYDGLTLNIRTLTCPDCGSVHNRDINASINILNEVKRICTVGTTEIKACETMDSLEPSKQESPTS